MLRVIANDFRLERPLSEGGMGSVYVAEQISTGKRRALKLMKPELARDQAFRDRFALEARVGARIDSEHVVEVVGAGIDGPTGSPWLAMELLDGEDLHSMIERRDGISLAELKELFRQIGHALEKAHASGIVHRDLKPENLFVARPRREGVTFTVKILDFGIAKLVSDATSGAATSALGTPLWMAPEQAEAGRNLGPTADIWPLGLIAFFALTRQYYWRAAEDGGTLTALMREILLDALPSTVTRAGSRAQRLPRGFDAWFQRCVARDPACRFPAVGDAVSAFLRLGESLSESVFVETHQQPITRTVSLPSTHPPPVRKRRLLFSTAAIMLLALPTVLAGVYAYFYGWVRFHAERERGALDRQMNEQDERLEQDLAAARKLALTAHPGRPPLFTAPTAMVPVVEDDIAFGDDRPLLVAVLFCGWTDSSCAQQSEDLDHQFSETKYHLRVVFKNAVRPDDAHAMLAAEAARGVFESEGIVAFRTFRDLVFAHRGEVTRTNVLGWAQTAGVNDMTSFGEHLDARQWRPIVERDGELASRLHIAATTTITSCSGTVSDAYAQTLFAIQQWHDTDAGEVLTDDVFGYSALCAAAEARAKFDHDKLKKEPHYWFEPFPLAPQASEFALVEFGIRFNLARSTHSSEKLRMMLNDEVVYAGAKLPGERVAAILTAGDSGTRMPIDIERFVDASDSARALIRFRFLSSTKSGSDVTEQRVRTVRVNHQWRISDIESEEPLRPSRCPDDSIVKTLRLPSLSKTLLAGPSVAEQERGCLVRVIALGSQCLGDTCTILSTCYGDSGAELKYLGLHLASGTLNGDTFEAIVRAHDNPSAKGFCGGPLSERTDLGRE